MYIPKMAEKLRVTGQVRQVNERVGWLEVRVKGQVCRVLEMYNSYILSK